MALVVASRSTALLWATIALAFGSVPACKGEPPSEEAPIETSKQPAVQAQSQAKETFGAPLSDLRETPLSDVLASPDQYAGKTVRVSGNARRVCQRKGCWMELATSSDAAAPACRVNFKNYGFFVPTDSAGAAAVLEGEVKLKKVRPSRVRHLEEEGAVFTSKNEDGSANEIQIVANGVEMIR